MIQNIKYCPTLHTRIAEMKAFGQLPSQTKDQIFPLLLTRPWPNAKHAATTWDRIGEAVGNRRFALDLDRTQQFNGSNKASAVSFQGLFDGKSGFANYYDAVTDISLAIPVLRTLGGTASDFRTQVQNIDRLDRGAIVRIEYGQISSPFDLVDNALKSIKDVIFFVDTGWSRDILSRELWASSIIEHITRGNPETEIVISGSSFPESFSSFGKRRSTRVEERVLYAGLTRKHNAATLIYGDWGSTRPPAASVPMINIPRIDLPTRSEWISFRRDQTLAIEEDYRDIAKRVVQDSGWSGDLNIWGTYIIDWTAKGEPGAIRGSATAAAARINIHLHRQAFFNGTDILSDGDEPFTDD